LKTAIKSILFSLIIILTLSGCKPKRSQLIVDEIYLSKHVVGPPFRGTIRFNPPIQGRNQAASIDTTTEIPFCFRAIKISHSAYSPKLIIKVNKEGKLQGYYKNCLSETEGYYETMLPDSMITYFNSQIYKMNHKKFKISVFNKSYAFEGFYDGPEYFVYFKKDNKIRMDFCFINSKSPQNTISFIDSLYNYMGKVKLKDKPSEYFRMDTLIVLKTEELRGKNY